MSLGWGLRGSIGGGPLGAMIPGAMIGLALCLLLGRTSDAGRIAAMAAIGVGFGGQETYGQTVGLSLQPETFRWAILGFAIKGAAWGLLGGAFLGMALGRISVKRAAAGLCLMALGTWIGWQAINQPKLIYFSNLLDRPREELWAGLLLGGVFLLAWLRARVPGLFALYGAIGGGIGFAFGASLQPWGRDVWAAMPLGWWKAMELTFGALLGLAFGACAWRLRQKLADPLPDVGGARVRALPSLAHAFIAIALAIVVDQLLPVRFGYTLGGAALALLVLFSDSIAWQTAITATYAAFAWDLLKNQKILPEPVLWLWVIATTAIVALVVARHARPRPMFLLLTWTAVATDFRHILPPKPIGPAEVTMLTVFVLFAAAIHACSRTHLRLELPSTGN
jgi:hypothetical protein